MEWSAGLGRAGTWVAATREGQPGGAGWGPGPADLLCRCPGGLGPLGCHSDGGHACPALGSRSPPGLMPTAPLSLCPAVLLFHLLCLGGGTGVSQGKSGVP